MRQITAQMQLLSPLHHSSFGGARSNVVTCRRMDVLAPDGTIESVPVVSGNALRGQMRRAVFRDLLDRLDLADHPNHDRIYAAVANGGTLTGSDANVRPAAMRQLREDCPPLSLFGSALYQYMLAGRISVGICWPVCDITLAKGLVPAEPQLPVSSYLVKETAYVRLPEKERQNTEETKVGPMPYTVETIPAGTTLVSDLRFFSETTELEMSCAAWALSCIDQMGGKGGIGLGRVKLDHSGDPSLYAAWLSEDLGAARAALERI